MSEKLRAYLQLLRLSNVLTAVADVWMGIVVATGSLHPPLTCVLLTATSVLLYLSGMVLNDVHDVNVDRRERPTRPIPSGRITLESAKRLGYGMMLGGVCTAAAASYYAETGLFFVVAFCLAFLIGSYNAGPRGAVDGPLTMGLCRATNVILGLSAVTAAGVPRAIEQPVQELWFIAAGTMVYIVGMTMFARNEAAESRRGALTFATVVSLSGLAIFAMGPKFTASTLELTASDFRWYLLWTVLAMLVGRRYVAAILQPTPRHVQQAVGNAIRSIIVIDAALAWGYADPFWGLAILALLPPTVLLAQFIPQT